MYIKIKLIKMKKHLVSIRYDVYGKMYYFQGLINEVIGDNGKAVFFPNDIFRKAFGFELPLYSTIICG